MAARLSATATPRVSGYRNTKGKDAVGFDIEYAEYSVEFEGVTVWRRFASFVALNNTLSQKLELPHVLPITSTGLHRWFIDEKVKAQRGVELDTYLCRAFAATPAGTLPPHELLTFVGQEVDSTDAVTKAIAAAKAKLVAETNGPVEEKTSWFSLPRWGTLGDLLGVPKMDQTPLSDKPATTAS